MGGAVLCEMAMRDRGSPSGGGGGAPNVEESVDTWEDATDGAGEGATGEELLEDPGVE